MFLVLMSPVTYLTHTRLWSILLMMTELLRVCGWGMIFAPQIFGCTASSTKRSCACRILNILTRFYRFFNLSMFLTGLILLLLISRPCILLQGRMLTSFILLLMFIRGLVALLMLLILYPYREVGFIGKHGQNPNICLRSESITPIQPYGTPFERRQKGKELGHRVTRQRRRSRAPTSGGWTGVSSVEGKRTERFSENSSRYRDSLKSEVRLPRD